MVLADMKGRMSAAQRSTGTWLAVKGQGFACAGGACRKRVKGTARRAKGKKARLVFGSAAWRKKFMRKKRRRR